MKKENIRHFYPLVVVIPFVIFVIRAHFATKQMIHEDFNGILLYKKFYYPSGVIFHLKNKDKIRKDNVGLGLDFYKKIAIGDSLVKQKGVLFIEVYRKNDNNKYVFIHKLNY